LFWGENKIGYAGNEDTEEHDRAAADSVAQLSPERGEDELHDGEDCRNQTNHEGIGSKVLGISRQQREYNPNPIRSSMTVRRRMKRGDFFMKSRFGLFS